MESINNAWQNNWSNKELKELRKGAGNFRSRTIALKQVCVLCDKLFLGANAKRKYCVNCMEHGYYLKIKND